MKVSTRGRYALHLMLDLALKYRRTGAFEDVAKRQEISEKYLNRSSRFE